MIDCLDKLPKIRQKVFDKLEKVAETISDLKGKEGTDNGEKIRIRIAVKKRRKEIKDASDL